MIFSYTYPTSRGKRKLVFVPASEATSDEVTFVPVPPPSDGLEYYTMDVDFRLLTEEERNNLFQIMERE